MIIGIPFSYFFVLVYIVAHDYDLIIEAWTTEYLFLPKTYRNCHGNIIKCLPKVEPCDFLEDFLAKLAFRID